MNPGIGTPSFYAQALKNAPIITRYLQENEFDDTGLVLSERGWDNIGFRLKPGAVGCLVKFLEERPARTRQDPDGKKIVGPIPSRVYHASQVQSIPDLEFRVRKRSCDELEGVDEEAG